VDFIHDRLASGKSFRIFNILDLFSRRAFKPLVNSILPENSGTSRSFVSGIRASGDASAGPGFRSWDFQAVLRKLEHDLDEIVFKRSPGVFEPLSRDIILSFAQGKII